MTVVLTWNIQCGLGCDGETDLARIAATIAERDPDVICLQEVAQNMPEFDGGADQVAELARHFGRYECYFGSALDRADGSGGKRARFGNAILSRLPVVQFFTHPLPQPAIVGVKHMPRQATEAVVVATVGPLRIVTTHLEFHSEVQRIAQVQYLRTLQAEVSAMIASPGEDPGSGPYALAPRPASTLYCGDFNAGPGDAVYALMTAPLPTGGFLRDAWTALHPNDPHSPTTGMFDRKQWPQGPHCRDYFFVTEDIANRLVSIDVDVDVDQSDHQPVTLWLR